jgi:acyl carrier protein
LAGIWADVLGLQQIGIYDNFFELGGDSLLAMHIASRVRETFEVDLSLTNLLEQSTVISLAEYIEMSRWKSQTSFTNTDQENREEIEL